ncbi:MAG: hypothetical protein PVJ57_10780 [Phycisphaerae bacterium]
MSGFWRILLRIVFVYACWLGMMATHEAGHVLHAYAAGGRVARVIVPWVGFSRTDLAENPHPHFVAWGGAVWGCLIPLGLLAVAAALRFRRVAWVQFFAGFCLVANGTYLATGSAIDAGDCDDLMRCGTPRWLLVAVGTPLAASGLYLWHRLGLRAVEDGTEARQ